MLKQKSLKDLGRQSANTIVITPVYVSLLIQRQNVIELKYLTCRWQ